MLWLIFTMLFFSVMIKFSEQKIEPSLRIKVNLIELKYDIILKEVLNINENMEKFWETLNATQVKCANTAGLISKETSVNNGTSSTQSYDTYPRGIKQILSRIEKGVRDEKHVSRKRWIDFQTKYENEVCRCDDTSSLMDLQLSNILSMVNTIDTVQTGVRSEQNKLHSDQVTLLIEQDKLRTDLSTLKREMDQVQKENIKLKEEMANIKSETKEQNKKNKKETDDFTNKLNDINEISKKLKDELDLVRNAFHLLNLKYNGWVQHDDSIYKMFDEKLSWSDAMDKCKSESIGKGFLAELQNMNELNFVTGLSNKKYFWLGGCDKDTEGSWKWCGSGSDVTFENWKDNEPNNDGGKENCLHGYAGYTARAGDFEGEWNDSNCNEKFAFVCEVVL